MAGIVLIIILSTMILSYAIWPKYGIFISTYLTYLVDKKTFNFNILRMEYSMLDYHYSIARELSNLKIIGKMFDNYKAIYFELLYRKS